MEKILRVVDSGSTMLNKPWRRVLMAELHRGYALVGVNGQYQGDDGKWYTNHGDSFGVQIAPWLVGVQHMWYDGPHCQLSLGFIRIVWSGNYRTGECTKCLKEIQGDQ
jgi:hypothetical protein